MSAFSSASGSNLTVKVQGPSNPQVQAQPLLALVENTVVLPEGTKRFQLKLREPQTLKLRTVLGGDYFTVPKHVAYAEDGLNTVGVAFSVEVETAGTLELLIWI